MLLPFDYYEEYLSTTDGPKYKTTGDTCLNLSLH